MQQPGCEILAVLPMEAAPGDAVALAVRWDAVEQDDVALSIGAEPCETGTTVVLAPYWGESVVSIPVVEADPRGDAVIAGLHPTPASEVVQIELGATQAGRATVEIQDMSGRTIRLYSVSVDRGRSLHDIPLQGVAPGCYRVVVRESDRTSVVPLVVVR